MTAVTRFFAILHLAICMPFRWLTGKTHQLGHRNWGARSMGRAIDIIHTACKDIIEDTGLIHDESFMMHIFDQLRQELPEFDEYLDYMFETKSLDNVQSNAEQKQVINKRLIKELFAPSDRDNQDSTKMLEAIAAVGIQAFVDELEHKKKATYKYLSISGSAFSYAHCSDSEKANMIGKMAMNDQAESSFAGVTAQIQFYGRIGMCHAAAVSDTGRNGFLSRPTTKQDIRDIKQGLFHGLPEELQLTLGMVAMEDTRATHASNEEALERQRKFRQEKEEIAKEKRYEDAEEAFIESLIYHRMGKSDAYWKTVGEVTAGLKELKHKKDKMAALKDNIQIRYKGFGWEDCKTPWSEGGSQKSVADLTNRLKELIRLENRYKWKIPTEPEVSVPKRKSLPVLGTQTHQAEELNRKASENKEAISKRAREKWSNRDESELKSAPARMQSKTAPPLESLIGQKIEYLCTVDEDEAGTIKRELWMSGTIKEVSGDGNWLVSARARTKCFAKGEAADVDWDPVQSANYKGGLSRVELKPRLWNKDVLGAWRKDIGEVDYGRD